jgi:hypothetical protein
MSVRSLIDVIILLLQHSILRPQTTSPTASSEIASLSERVVYPAALGVPGARQMINGSQQPKSG